jgi:hypothetical protein
MLALADVRSVRSACVLGHPPIVHWDWDTHPSCIVLGHPPTKSVERAQTCGFGTFGLAGEPDGCPGIAVPSGTWPETSMTLTP